MCPRGSELTIPTCRASFGDSGVCRHNFSLTALLDYRIQIGITA
jgi:hypothetical protein